MHVNRQTDKQTYRDGLGREMGWWREMGCMRNMGCMREMADALWEGHTLLKTEMSAHGATDTQTDRQTDTQK